MTAIKPDRGARFCPSSLLGSLVPDVDASSLASPGEARSRMNPRRLASPTGLHTPPYNSYIPPVVTFLRGLVLRRVA